MKHRASVRLWLALFLITLEAGYAIWNTALDVIIRLVPQSHQFLDPALVEFIRTVSWMQELVFFSAVTAVCVSVVLVLRRSIWVLAVYGANVFLSKADWLISGLNGVEVFTMRGYLSLIYQTVVIGLLIWMSYREELD